MSAALHALLRGAIDYAGLFPPASLNLSQTARNYAAYGAGEYAWALGRLILPAAKLEDFSHSAGAATTPVSVLLSEAGAVDEVAFALRTLPNADVFECRVRRPEKVRALRASLPETATLFVEVPLDAASAPLIAAIQAASACAKVRTGGVTADAIPASLSLARFLRLCAAAKVTCKATAGLHHPLRSEQALTYARESPRGTMHGFVNVLLAAVLASRDADEQTISEVLDDSDAKHFHFDDVSALWCETVFTTQQIETMRHDILRSFGSCSFTEPFDELRALGWMHG